jgi:predicted nuclease of predicted toxin-antitoxin system
VKLLFDQNLPRSLVATVQGQFPGSTHVRDVGLDRATDTGIWEYAKDNGMTVVSKDSDFHQRSFALGAPPKVDWLRLGNCSASDVKDILRTSAAQIQVFWADADAALLVLS